VHFQDPPHVRWTGVSQYNRKGCNREKILTKTGINASYRAAVFAPFCRLMKDKLSDTKDEHGRNLSGTWKTNFRIPMLNTGGTNVRVEESLFNRHSIKFVGQFYLEGMRSFRCLQTSIVQLVALKISYSYTIMRIEHWSFCCQFLRSEGPPLFASFKQSNLLLPSFCLNASRRTRERESERYRCLIEHLVFELPNQRDRSSSM